MGEGLVRKDFKVMDVKLTMVHGHDIKMEKVIMLLKNVIVGKFQFKMRFHGDLFKWVDENWKPFLGYTLVVHLLVKGWICLEFLTE